MRHCLTERIKTDKSGKTIVKDCLAELLDSPVRQSCCLTEKQIKEIYMYEFFD